MSAIAQRQLVAFVDLQSNRYAMIKSGEIRVIQPYRAGLPASLPTVKSGPA
jgi:hypothetical protein